jgi:hypothetical protein
VPVRAGGDQHGIDIIAGQQFAQVAVGGAVLIAVFVVRHFLDRLAPVGFDVADGDELDIRGLEEDVEHVAAAVADPDRAKETRSGPGRQVRSSSGLGVVGCRA